MFTFRAPICVCIFILCPLLAVGQGDKWTGTWHMEYRPNVNAYTVSVEIKIGAPDNNMLYPAQLKIDYVSFSGTYELLLAKKNDHQLGIGRNKIAIAETPFKLGPWMLYLNGVLNMSKTGDVTIERMWMNSFNLFMNNIYNDDEIYLVIRNDLRDLLYQRPFNLKKTDNTPWVDPDTYRITHPEGDSIFFGIYDKVKVYDSIIPVFIRDEDVEDRDTVSFVHNGKTLLNRAYISPGGSLFQVKLDTGMNTMAFFADNYGRLPPNTGSFRIKTDSGSSFVYDFRDRASRYATFLVAQVYRQPRPQQPLAKPVPDTRVTERRNSILDKIGVSTGDVALELWDDAAEDGDSISIRLNDVPVVTGFPVLKKKQQLHVSLTPGENTLILLADNLGSIPPNTAVMKITAGRIRKYVRIKTDMKVNNVLVINYTP